MKQVIEYLNGMGIRDTAPVPFEKCRVLNERRLKGRTDIKTALMFLVPFYTGEFCEGNVSKYAVARDYHLFAEILGQDIRARFGDEMMIFSDTSPIDEVKAAAYGGLGLIGENGLLVTEKYGCYVFIGEILTNKEADYLPDQTKKCPACGRCKELCPAKDGLPCLSALTQKKGELTEREQDYIRRHGLVWGCDICMDACPYSVRVRESGFVTPVRFFTTHLKSRLTKEDIKGDISDRAYAWRGKQVLMRNLDIFSRDQITAELL